MQEGAVAGEWISIWLSPIAYLFLDAVLAVLFLSLLSLLLKTLRRVRPKKAPGA